VPGAVLQLDIPYDLPIVDIHDLKYYYAMKIGGAV
jgi:hypothetical protein